MADLLLKHVGKVYDNGFRAATDLNMDIEDKEFIVLVGPSGCGKSTILRMIAGLETITEGEMYIGDLLVNNIPPKARDIAMVFQSYALYPHMTVRDNIAFPLKIKGVAKAERYEKVKEVAQILQLEDNLDKKPAALSGGQRQRVALGRAMVRAPRLFLLDEPLSNLDAKLRVEMRAEIVNLWRKLTTTFIYVTHDQTEAMTMGTRIAILNHGRIEQFDRPEVLYSNPANKFVAEFIGSPQMNLFEGTLGADAKGTFVQIGKTRIPLTLAMKQRLTVSPAGRKIYAGIRPEAFFFGTREEELIRVSICLDNVEQVGADTFVYFKTPSAIRNCCARFSPAVDVRLDNVIAISFHPDSLYLFDRETGKSLLNRPSIFDQQGLRSMSEVKSGGLAYV